jgi:hypothetical protein
VRGKWFWGFPRCRAVCARPGMSAVAPLYEMRARIAETQSRKHMLRAMQEETEHSLGALNRSREMRRASPSRESAPDLSR